LFRAIETIRPLALLLIRFNPLKLFRRRPRPAPIIRPYVDFRRPLRRIGRLIFPIGLALFCLFYGFAFALTAPYLLVPFVVPIVVLVLLSIWALPDAPHAPTRSMEFCFAAVLISRILWPNYLAVELPGLPWITILRLAGVPMAFLLLICLSTSAQFRSELGQSLRAAPGLFTCTVGLMICEFATLPLSEHVTASLQLALLDLVYMVAMVFIGAWLGRIPGRASRYVDLLLLLAVPIMLMTVLEVRQQNLLWNGHVPSFLKINDPAAIRMMSSVTRGTTGEYRTKATFTTALGLAEYLAILTPFFIHKVVRSSSVTVRLLSTLALPLSFYCILTTQARLGVVGFLASCLLYILFWGIGRFTSKRGDLFGAAVVYGYPAFFAAFMVAVFSVHRLRILVLGGGEAQSSNEARASQISTGIPNIFRNPIGHGVGEAANYVGTYGGGDFITIDNYYLTLGLDVGIIGLGMFIGMFACSVFATSRSISKYYSIPEDELSLLTPTAVSICAFLVIKSVFSQTDNHMLLFALLGISAGLIYRVKAAGAAATAADRAQPRSHTPNSRGRRAFS